MRIIAGFVDFFLYQIGHIKPSLIKEDLMVMYHGVTQKNQANFNKRHVTKATFENQIRIFKKNYEIVDLAAFFDPNQKFKKSKLCLTFDDGYQNNLENAVPILQKYEAQASIYITGLSATNYPIIWADFLDLMERKASGRKICVQEHPFINISGCFVSELNGQSLREVIRYLNPSWEFKCSLVEALGGFEPKEFDKIADREVWQLLTNKEISELAGEKGITIGSHGYFHNNLGSLNLNDANTELLSSKAYLEGLTSKAITSIAFPDGSYNDKVKADAKALGMIYQLAAEGFRCATDQNDKHISNRKGVYNCGRPHTQLFDIFK